MIHTTNKSRREAEGRKRVEPSKPQGTPRSPKTIRNMCRYAHKTNQMASFPNIINAIISGGVTKAQLYGRHPTK